MVYDILVTGGAGYLGSTLVPALLQAGHRVTVLDNFLFRQNSLNHVCHDPNFKVVKGDIRVEATIAPLLKKADVVIPLAALVGAPMCNADPVGVSSCPRCRHTLANARPSGVTTTPTSPTRVV